MSSTMQTTTTMRTAQTQLPALPLTIEGTSVLHTMLHFRWTEGRKLGEPARAELVKEASLALEQMTHNPDGQSALFSLLGHKADLLLLPSRSSLDRRKRRQLHRTHV